jgi:hypothetical protein
MLSSDNIPESLTGGTVSMISDSLVTIDFGVPKHESEACHAIGTVELTTDDARTVVRSNIAGWLRASASRVSTKFGGGSSSFKFKSALLFTTQVYGTRLVAGILHSMADQIEPVAKNLLTDLVRAVHHGDIEVETGFESFYYSGGEEKEKKVTKDIPKEVSTSTVRSEGSTTAPSEVVDEPMVIKKVTRVLGAINTPSLVVRTTNHVRANKRGIRIPLASGDIANSAYLELGRLYPNAETKAMVFTVCSRTVNALKKMGDPRFKSLRAKEMILVVDWAVKMYFEPTLGEEDIKRFNKEAAVGGKTVQTSYVQLSV